MWNWSFLKSSLASIRSAWFQQPVFWEESTQIYHNSSVYRGFPIGSIGSGGFHLDTAGGFRDLRINNNWMCGVQEAKGSFWAVSCQTQSQSETRILRQRLQKKKEFTNIKPIQESQFLGNIPFFEQTFEDQWPLHIRVEGGAPLIPNRPKDSSLPAAWFAFTLTHTGEEPADVRLAFSWENILGCGGTGQTGVRVKNGRPIGLFGQMRYDDRASNRQQPFQLDGMEGLIFLTEQSCPPNSHQQSTLGHYLLLQEEVEGVTLQRIVNWDASESAPAWLRELKPQENTAAGQRQRNTKIPAGALISSCQLQPGEQVTIPFWFVWWTPNHTVEKEPIRCALKNAHQGVRVGHFYENHFASSEELVMYLSNERERLWRETLALPKLLEESSLPTWLQHMMCNATSSVLSNTILPKDGNLYTIEGTGWKWYFGGLCGTNDQRLSSHPYTATFFPTLDKTEVDSFRKLHKDGAVPHGNGNCDLALGDADVPYGWPVRILGALEETRWPDLTMSSILQTYRLAKTTGDSAWLEEAWPDLWQMFEYLQSISVHGVPEGGSTFDTFSFPGTALYTATLYLASIAALRELAGRFEPKRISLLDDTKEKVQARIQAVLWDPRGFFRSCESKDTLFFGGMAGDWMARYCGLPPGLHPDQVHSHLKHLHRVLFAGRDGTEGRSAFPVSEATFEGKAVNTWVAGVFKIFGYAWQVVSYHGMQCLYHGLYNEGLETIKILYDRIWKRGWPWSADLYGNAGAIYMTHPVIWALPQALAGSFLDAEQGILQLAPKCIPQFSSQELPLLFPKFWGMLSLEHGSRQRTIQIHRHFGEPVQIEKLRLPARDGGWQTQTLQPAWNCQEGSCFSFFWEDGS